MAEIVSKQFVATGGRRLIVAIVAIITCGAVGYFADGGLSKWTAIGIGVVTLGYYNTKYAEVLAETLPVLFNRWFGTPPMGNTPK